MRYSNTPGVSPDELSQEALGKREALIKLFALEHNQINLRNAYSDFQKYVPTFIVDLTLVEKDFIFMLETGWRNNPPHIQKKRENDILNQGFRKTLRNALACKDFSSPPSFVQFILMEIYDPDEAWEISTILREKYLSLFEEVSEKK